MLPQTILSIILALCVTAPGSHAFSSPTVESTHVADRFKAPNADTPSTLKDEWQKADAALWKYVEESVPAVLDHTGSAAFDEHLKGVQAVLRFWGAPDYLTNAGLFHSIFGTEGFQGFSLPLSERKAIQNLIGEKAEWLCFVFCMIDRSTLDQTVFAYDGRIQDDKIFYMKARPELGRFDIHMDKDEWLDFVELTLADWLEQVEGAASKPSSLFLWKAGEAYAYRRLAYRKMAEILSKERAPRLATIPTAMLNAVMATESPETRHLVQARTPPMSDATAHAYDALRAVGEPIPVDMSPQPMTSETCEV
mmetsp:Transcript_2342/g.6741  ORF Transcript_2342/g.6741 Transcript_2342/m.6741 type:complete len:308 (-) Transcript_2342:1603-2526(-)